jgi:putative hydrolase of HD superfamily
MVKDLSTFFDAAIKLKYVDRAGWKAKAGVKDPESVADHTYAMCVIGMAMSDVMGLDTKKVLKMTILHDLGESIVGDYMPGQVSAKRKLAEESSAIKKIISSLPAKVKAEYLKIWHEYQQGRTKEARLVRRVDKFELALQAARYAKDGRSKKLLQQFFETAHSAVDVDNDALTKILKSLSPGTRKKK